MKTLFNYFACLIFSFVGVLNLMRGNDPGFGLALILVSLYFIPQVSDWLSGKLKIKLPFFLKILLFAVLTWVNLAVGAIAEGYY